MHSLKIGDLQKFQNEASFAGNYTVLLQGQSRMIAYHPEWPSCQHEMKSARETFDFWRAQCAGGSR